MIGRIFTSVLSGAVFLSALYARPSSVTLSLSEAVDEICLSTSHARSLRLTYENQSLLYANYRKSFLPALGLSFSPFSLNRSIQRLQQPSDGSYTYVEDYSGSSTAALVLRQQVGPTGGTLLLGTSLNYLREFSEGRNSFNSRPFYISYAQPLWGGFRTYRYTQRIQRLTYELSFRQCVRQLVVLQQQVLTQYLSCFLAQLTYTHAQSMATASDTLLQVARQQKEGGRITSYEYKQMELQSAESTLSVLTERQNLESSLRALATLLELDNVPSIPGRLSTSFPELSLSEIRCHIERNNPQYLQNALQLQQAEFDRFTAYKESRLNGEVSIDYGINQYGNDFVAVYRHPSTQQAVSLTLSFPLFQWGIERNKRRITDNEYAISEIAVNRTQREFENTILETVSDYNNALSRCDLAERTYLLSEENFRLMVRRFGMDRLSVGELIEARRNLFGQLEQYYQTLYTLYTTYYAIRLMTLYDFQRQEDMGHLLFATETIAR